MTHGATLVCDPCAAALGEATVARVRAALPGASEPRWLAPDIAADLFFTSDLDASDRAAAEALRSVLGRSM
jgi:hypothetical protein